VGCQGLVTGRTGHPAYKNLCHIPKGSLMNQEAEEGWGELADQGLLWKRALKQRRQQQRCLILRVVKALPLHMDRSVVFARLRQCESPSNTWFLQAPESATQMTSRSVQPFVQGSPLWQTEDRPCYSVCNNVLRLCGTAMWPNNTKRSQNTCGGLEILAAHAHAPLALSAARCEQCRFIPEMIA